jgi:predicted amidohydrolase
VTTFDTVRVAAIQATPVVLDADATIEKASGLLEEAAAAGARLAVLPECFVSLYPDYTWTAAACADRGAFDELYARMWEESVEVPGAQVDRLVETCRRTGIHCAIGVNEREAGGSFTIYNSLVVCCTSTGS